MPTKQSESAPSFLQVYTQVRRDRMKHSFHSTICRFRAELTRLGIMDKLLKELNKQFKKHGISRIDQGAPGCHYAGYAP